MVVILIQTFSFTDPSSVKVTTFELNKTLRMIALRFERCFIAVFEIMKKEQLPGCLEIRMEEGHGQKPNSFDKV